MGRRRYIAVGNKWVEVTQDYEPPPAHAGAYIVGDRHYDGLRSPIDGADISTRAKHKEYMRANGLVTADDFKNEWAKAAEKRAEVFQGVDPRRGRDIAEAAQRVAQGYKPRRMINE